MIRKKKNSLIRAYFNLTKTPNKRDNNFYNLFQNNKIYNWKTIFYKLTVSRVPDVLFFNLFYALQYSKIHILGFYVQFSLGSNSHGIFMIAD